jgi:glutathione S-transferase
MKLYITPGSPYARIARICVLEKQLEGRVEIVVAQTRSVESPYYRIAPSGRVPYLVRDDGVGLEESSVICRYLDHLDGNPEFDLPTDEGVWEAHRLGALATSLIDGLSVWLREIRRPKNEQSPEIIQHETDRARRLIILWETEIDCPTMQGKLNLAQIALVYARLGSRRAIVIFGGARGTRDFASGSTTWLRARRSRRRFRPRPVDCRRKLPDRCDLLGSDRCLLQSSIVAQQSDYQATDHGAHGDSKQPKRKTPRRVSDQSHGIRPEETA